MLRLRRMVDIMKPTNPFHSVNKDRWDATSDHWARAANTRGTWRGCLTEPNLVLSDVELHYLAETAGKRVAEWEGGKRSVNLPLSNSPGVDTLLDSYWWRSGDAQQRRTFPREDVESIVRRARRSRPSPSTYVRACSAPIIVDRAAARTSARATSRPASPLRRSKAAALPSAQGSRPSAAR